MRLELSVSLHGLNKKILPVSPQKNINKKMHSTAVLNF